MKINFYVGGAVAMWLLVAMVIAAELFAPFKDMLSSIFSHHWIGKLVIVMIVFFLAGFLFRDKQLTGEFPNSELAWKSALGSLAAVFLFYVIHFFA